MNQCLLFDCDGTLVDSERLCNIGMVLKFREYGIELDADELVVRFRGWKLAKIISVLEKEFDISLPENFIDEYRSIVTELFETDLKPIDYIEETLKNLNHPMAVVSSGPVHKIQQALRVCGLTNYFGGNIYSSYEIGVWKPDPRIYMYAAKDMGFPEERCIVIDDGPVGVEAGHKAGMKTLFYNRFNESCEFSSVISFNSMKELPGLIHT
jgi:HAD superfamily hydrolase (TIGR01509 family)